MFFKDNNFAVFLWLEVYPMRGNLQGVKIFQIGHVVNHYNFLKHKICEINHKNGHNHDKI